MLLLGQRYRERLEPGLRTWTEDILWLPDNPALDERLAGHADLSVLVAKDHAVIAAAEEYDPLVNYLTNRGIKIFRSSVQGNTYPEDAGLCACLTGMYSIYNPKTADPVIIPLLTGISVTVPQGYTKCSICVVSDDAIITADNIIARRASAAGMDVLHITPGYIKLNGFREGFIGGASFVLNDHTIAFTGSLNAHPDRDRIQQFCAKHGVQSVILTTEPIFDIGGAISLP